MNNSTRRDQSSPSSRSFSAVDQNSGEYRTSDLYLSAFLVVSGVKLNRTARDGRGKVYFFFEDEENHVNEIKNSYFNCKGKVSARRMADEIRNLKHMIHS